VLGIVSAANPSVSARLFPAGLWLPQDSFDRSAGYLNGRRIAGGQFFSAVATHLHPSEQLHVFCPEEAGRELLRNQCAHTADQLTLHSEPRHQELARIGCLHLADPSLVAHARRRLPLREADYSISGLIHTLCSRSAIDAISDCVASDLYPWDALVCSSASGRAVVHQIWQSRMEFLARRCSAEVISDAWMPKTPVIPLPGPACQPYQPHLSRHDRRLDARSQLGLDPEAFVVCTVGRLSFSSKAHPIALYRSLAALAASLDQRLVLVECGAYPSPDVRCTYERLAMSFQGFERVVVGGDAMASEIQKWQVYAAADVFVSLADSIQETFGLTLLEAMCAELPVVASDWDGYREIVVPGVTGELISTADVLPALDEDRMQVGYYSDQLDYDRWVGMASLGVVVDHDLTVAQLRALAACASTRSRLAAAGCARFHAVYAPPVVISQYRQLWQELAAVRAHALTSTVWSSGRAPSMARLFAGYPTGAFAPVAVELLDPARVDELLSVGLGVWFGRLVFGTAGQACLQQLCSAGQINLDDLTGMGYSRSQASRILTVLVKFGLARERLI